MDIKPTRNEKRHRTGLKEVEHKWAAKAGTHRHDRLGVLSGPRRFTLDTIWGLHRQHGSPARGATGVVIIAWVLDSGHASLVRVDQNGNSSLLAHVDQEVQIPSSE